MSVLPPSDDPHVVSGSRPEIAAAAQALVTPRGVISHDCAALAWGLPVLRRVTRPVITCRATANAGGDPRGRAQQAQLFRGDVEKWFGVDITVVARTVADMARTAGARSGLAAADAALRERLTTVEQLRRCVLDATRWPGVRTARRIVELASHLAESPLESITRLAVDDAGIPVPELQKWINTARGWFRVDGLWIAERVVLECDGLAKYGKIDDIHAEKRRELALRRAGYEVVRVTWDDVTRHETATMAEIRRTLSGR